MKLHSHFFVPIDPECRAAKFRGKALDLPEDVNMEIDDYFLEHELSMLNEGLVIGSSNEKEDRLLSKGENKEYGEIFDFDDPALEQAMLQLNIEEKKVDEVDKDRGGPIPNATVEVADPWDDDDKLDSQLLEVAKNLPQVFS
jgi:hypothetical protein